MKTQKQIWDDIAPEWHEHKQKPSELTKSFLEKQTGKILETGAGSGRHLTKIKDGKMYLTDFSEKMIELAIQKSKERKIEAEFEIADMKKLPYEDNFFDGAISISAIHSIPKEDQKKAIKELKRVLKPKAQALIAVWNRNSKRFKRYKTNERFIGWTDKGKRYYYLFDEKEIHELFKKEGFKILESQNSEMMIRFVIEKSTNL